MPRTSEPVKAPANRVCGPYDVDDDDSLAICGHCNGSGEGNYDGSRCVWCKGHGTEPRRDDDCDDGEDYYDDQRAGLE